jgi:hypothetical protein
MPVEVWPRYRAHGAGKLRPGDHPGAAAAGSGDHGGPDGGKSAEATDEEWQLTNQAIGIGRG